MSGANHDERLHLALEVLDGLSVGDAFGEALSYQCYRVRELCDFSVYTDGSVRYTDDTEMALAVMQVLREVKSIEEDLLAFRFSARFREDPDRGYGRMARHVLREIGSGGDWRVVSAGVFGGGGSFGNGAAMRVGSIGAYFSGEPEKIVEMATRSARITHFHAEGIAGAVAVAIAVGAAVEARGLELGDAQKAIWSAVLEATPEGETKRCLVGAYKMLDAESKEVAKAFGNGAEISAQDTVPFCVWNACRCLDDYREAFLSTVEVDGDCDTNAAIVGAIVCGFLGRAGIPPEWLRVREKLPDK